MTQGCKHGEVAGMFCELCADEAYNRYGDGLRNIAGPAYPKQSANEYARAAMAETKPARGQVDGDHYKKLPIQPFAYSMANKLDPLQHTIIKYVTRFRDKGGIKDLRKAIHCTELLIAWEEGGLPAFDLQVKLDEITQEGE